MNGSGTQNDPYIPKDWDELVAAANVGEAYVRLSAGALWDLNEKYPEGAPTVEMYCNEIDGNGAEIRNIRSFGTIFTPGNYCLHGITIKDLKVINSYLTSATFVKCAANNHMTLNLLRCEMAGELYGNSKFFNADGCTINTDKSSFRCHLAGSSVFYTGYSGSLNLENSRIDFSGESGASQPIYYPRLRSCLVTGELAGQSAQVTFTDSSDASYIDCTFDGFSSIAYGGVAPFVINIDKTGSANVSSNFIQGTSVQIRNKDWLHSHGFPCR